MGVAKDKKGNLSPVTGPVMRCPRRPCACPFGEFDRGNLARRIERQRVFLGAVWGKQ